MTESVESHVAGDTPPVEVTTGQNPAASIIWLHGLGADGHDFEPVVAEMGGKLPCAVRFVLPHAPYRPVTINDGYVMRAWYDMGWSERGYVQNASHIAESVSVIRQLIATEQGRGIASSRIVLGGFSQGGVIALSAGLTYPEPLAGIVALSAPVHDAAALSAGANPTQMKTRIFLAHGSHDSMAPIALGRTANRVLTGAGFPVQWEEYPMDHTVCVEELAAIAGFLATVLR